MMGIVIYFAAVFPKDVDTVRDYLTYVNHFFFPFIRHPPVSLIYHRVFLKGGGKQHEKKKAAFAYLALVLLSGCWDSTNIEELNMAIGFGLDKGDDGHKL
ncbi:hypothetical protein BsIDN1_58050 [Bacillus safensis]|uniref:Uncharacterized protein n=1 Tax=Bacillus safensis TaxID=561879 RepID=A0A5S9MFB9_BACIA|nr:hypothetical protein BsIDN1_58050 [Bacillus safensis]